jgi:hypothetical protein
MSQYTDYTDGFEEKLKHINCRIIDSQFAIDEGNPVNVKEEEDFIWLIQAIAQREGLTPVFKRLFGWDETVYSVFYNGKRLSHTLHKSPEPEPEDKTVDTGPDCDYIDQEGNPHWN